MSNSEQGASNLSLPRLSETLGPATILAFFFIGFGWFYSSSFFQYFGISHTELNLSDRYYITRSINPLLVPLATMLAIIAASVGIHSALSRITQRRHLLKQTLRLNTLAQIVAIAIAGTALIGIRGSLYSSFYFVRPVMFAFGTALLAYAIWFRQRLMDQHGLPRYLNRRTLTAVMTCLSLIAVISLLLVFITYAGHYGRSDAYLLALNIDQVPGVVIYSTNQLYLESMSVTETVLDNKEGGYRFQYSELRLLLHSGSRYYLLPDGYSVADQKTIIINEVDSLRIEIIRS